MTLKMKPIMCLWVLGLVLLGCGGQAGVVVDIGSWPDGAVSLRVTGILNGTPSLQPLFYSPQTTRFVVYLPPDHSGQLNLALAALDASNCVQASAQTQVGIGGGLQALAQVALPLAVVSPALCAPPALQGVTPAVGPTHNGTPVTLMLSGKNFRPGAGNSPR